MVKRERRGKNRALILALVQNSKFLPFHSHRWWLLAPPISGTTSCTLYGTSTRVSLELWQPWTGPLFPEERKRERERERERESEWVSEWVSVSQSLKGVSWPDVHSTDAKSDQSNQIMVAPPSLIELSSNDSSSFYCSHRSTHANVTTPLDSPLSRGGHLKGTGR